MCLVKWWRPTNLTDYIKRAIHEKVTQILVRLLWHHGILVGEGSGSEKNGQMFDVILNGSFKLFFIWWHLVAFIDTHLYEVIRHQLSYKYSD